MDEDKTDVEESTAKRIRTSSIITRPNFFMAVQVSNPVIHQAVSIIQNIITSKKPLYKSALIKLITLHITLCTLHLTRNADIRRAKTALQKLETEIKEMLRKQPITLKFKGIGTFKNEVVFAKVEDGEPLQRMMELHIHLIRALKDEGLIVKDKFDPHLTIMKMSKDWKLRKKESQAVESQARSLNLQPAAYRLFLAEQRIDKDGKFHTIHQKIMVNNGDNRAHQNQPENNMNVETVISEKCLK